MENNLNARLRSLAQQTPILTDQQVKEFSNETGSSPAEIRTGFAKQLTALKKGLQENEDRGDDSANLREMMDGGGKYEGERTAGRSTPVLLGHNLQAPNESKTFGALADQFSRIAEQANSGSLSTEQVTLLLSKMPLPDNEAIAAFWAPEATDQRADYHEALEQLAEAAPTAQMWDEPPRTVEASLMVFEMNLAVFEKDKAEAQQVGQAFADRFPNDPLVAWAQKLAGGDI